MGREMKNEMKKMGMFGHRRLQQHYNNPIKTINSEGKLCLGATAYDLTR